MAENVNCGSLVAHASVETRRVITEELFIRIGGQRVQLNLLNNVGSVADIDARNAIDTNSIAAGYIVRTEAPNVTWLWNGTAYVVLHSALTGDLLNHVRSADGGTYNPPATASAHHITADDGNVAINLLDLAIGGGLGGESITGKAFTLFIRATGADRAFTFASGFLDSRGQDISSITVLQDDVHVLHFLTFDNTTYMLADDPKGSFYANDGSIGPADRKVTLNSAKLTFDNAANDVEFVVQSNGRISQNIAGGSAQAFAHFASQLDDNLLAVLIDYLDTNNPEQALVVKNSTAERCIGMEKLAEGRFFSMYTGSDRIDFFVNTGSPNGSLVAGPGSMSFDPGGAVYIKKTGAGSTGWESIDTTP